MKKLLNSPLLWLAILLVGMLLFAMPIADRSGELRLEDGKDTHIALMIPKSEFDGVTKLRLKLVEQDDLELVLSAANEYGKPARYPKANGGAILVYFYPPTNGWTWARNRMDSAALARLFDKSSAK